MTGIPLPTGIRGDSQTPRQSEILRNCFFKQGDIGTIESRPVSRKNTDGIGKCRGSGLYKDELYQVSNDRLIKITLLDSTKPPIESNIIVTNIGEITGISNCILKRRLSFLLLKFISLKDFCNINELIINLEIKRQIIKKIPILKMNQIWLFKFLIKVQWEKIRSSFLLLSVLLFYWFPTILVLEQPSHGQSFA